MSEYDDYIAKYGAPTSAADPQGFSNSLALMEGERVLGNNVYGKGLGDVARARIAASQPQAAVVDPAASLRDQALKDAQEKFQQALEANQANEADIKQGYKERRDRALATLGKISNSNVDEINRRFDNLAASTRNQANASGIGQTSILTTQLQGIERERAKALAAAGDVKAQREVGYDTQLSGDELAFKERVQNEYPNVNNLLEIAKTEGKGTQAGIDPNAFGFGGVGGGMGGGANMYGINPFAFGFSSPVQQPASTGARTVKAKPAVNAANAAIAANAYPAAAGPSAPVTGEYGFTPMNLSFGGASAAGPASPVVGQYTPQTYAQSRGFNFNPVAPPGPREDLFPLEYMGSIF